MRLVTFYKLVKMQTVENGAYYANGQCYVVKNGVATAVIGDEDIHIPGSHNIENILTVIAFNLCVRCTCSGNPSHY